MHTGQKSSTRNSMRGWKEQKVQRRTLEEIRTLRLGVEFPIQATVDGPDELGSKYWVTDLVVFDRCESETEGHYPAGYPTVDTLKRPETGHCRPNLHVET